MSERPSYEAYESKSKDERRQIVSESGILERKRFLLSSSPELRERMSKLQDTVYELKEKYPEIISLGLYGSFTKGYATPESDIDAKVNIDTEICVNSENPSTPEFIVEELKDRLKKDLNLNDQQVMGIQLHLFSKLDILKSINKGWGGSLSSLFLLSIGKDIDSYRRTVFDTLELMGKDGEKIWKDTMSNLAGFENIGFSYETREKRKSLYPQTLAEGRKYFLKEEPKYMEEGIFGKIKGILQSNYAKSRK